MIGGGGGRDILARAHARAQRVDVIELNRGIRDVVDEDLRSLVRRPLLAAAACSTAIGDGRSTLAERDTRYDQIHIGFTDTFSPSSAQAFALTENNLYTRRGLRGVPRPPAARRRARTSRGSDQRSGDEALRATVLDARRAEAARAWTRRAQRRGRCLAVRPPFNELRVRHGARASLSPFTPAELDRSGGSPGTQRGDGVAFAPGGPYRLEWGELARGLESARLLRRTTASTSARPPTTSRSSST